METKITNLKSHSLQIQVHSLKNKQRIDELARMLGGKIPAAKKHAAALLPNAKYINAEKYRTLPKPKPRPSSTHPRREK